MWTNGLYIIVMIMTAQDKIHFRYLMGKELVVRNPHVRQSYDDLSSLLLFQMIGQPPCTWTKILVLNVFWVQSCQSDKPLSLDEAYEPDLASVEVHEPSLQAFSKWASGSFICNVADQPWKIRFRCHGNKLINTKVKVVISVACSVNADGIECWDHVFSHRRRGGEGWIECIAAEQHDSLFLAPRNGLLLKLPNACDKTCQPTHRFLHTRFDIVHIIKVNNGHPLWGLLLLLLLR
mmetsp:Transcript_20852/g.52176  ORF Transcript_20852/g.52176 Transcript_20852/m.52176 type:complete len:235 (-) Transcript_20852:3664-4368(-)